MKKILLLAAAFGLALPSLAAAHPHGGKKSYFGGHKTKVAYPGDDVDGYRIPGYVFVYADLDNDGVLRGRELRRAVNRVIRQDQGGDHRD